jgi:meiosis-specific APC/C activator protein AMA1
VKLSSGSLRSPDRFLSSVDCQDPSVQKFRISKDPQTLSPSEKLIRHDSASMDAFSPRRSFTTPSPPAGAVNRRNSGSTRPGGMTSESSWVILTDHFRTEQSHLHRGFEC